MKLWLKRGILGAIIGLISSIPFAILDHKLKYDLFPAGMQTNTQINTGILSSIYGSPYFFVLEGMIIFFLIFAAYGYMYEKVSARKKELGQPIAPIERYQPI